MLVNHVRLCIVNFNKLKMMYWNVRHIRDEQAKPDEVTAEIPRYLCWHSVSYGYS